MTDTTDPTPTPAPTTVVVVEEPTHMSDQKRAFLAYKRRVAESGKPFFPYGVWHDVVAAAVTLLIIVGLSTIWFSQANCDSWFNTSCNRVSTPLEQEQFTPDHPGTVQRTEKGEPDETVKRPLLGLLYEEKADPTTTNYHPRPEWYFYFLFYLLILFSNPQLVVLGTIIVPTLWLVMLIAWPIIDRKKERRPSRRPVAMAAMVLTAVMLLSFTYLGSKSGKEKTGGPAGLTEGQTSLAGYTDLFDDPSYFETCQNCHMLGGIGNGGPGPNLDAVGTRLKVDEIAVILANGKGGMPALGGTAMTDEQAGQVAAFLSTLGDAGKAEDAAIQAYGVKEYAAATGSTAGGTDAGSGTVPEQAQDDSSDAGAQADATSQSADSTEPSSVN
ncbi:MAG: Cytochrome b subunit of the bc complex-like protein [Thermoleophilia bacterium]|nr:Cytochrome b subunit of the bc complex-like protein [Thermoleophilia bacterium]